jgi:hypothetical protein
MITLLCAWCFPANNLLIIIAGILTGAFTVWSAFNKEIISTKIVTVAASASAFVNIMLNGSFYPDLLDYQGSSNLAAIANKEKVDTAKTYYYNIGATAFAFDFYTKHLTPVLSIAEIKNKIAEAPWVFTNGSGIDTLKQYDLPLSITYKSHEFHVTTLNTGFLDPRTRKHQLDTLYLVKIAP